MHINFIMGIDMSMTFNAIVSQDTLVEITLGSEYITIHTIKDDGYRLHLQYGRLLREKVVIPYEMMEDSKVIEKPDGSILVRDEDDIVINIRFYKFTPIEEINND